MRVQALLAGVVVLMSAGAASAQHEVTHVVQQPPLAKRTPTAAPSAMVQGQSLAASALLRYADDARDKNDVDRSVAAALSRVPNARAIAKRMATRIRALPAADQQAAFGDRQRHLSRAVTAADFAPLASTSPAAVVGRANVAPASSPAPAPTAAATPEAYALHLTGIACRKAADADGVDEPVALAVAIVPSAKGLASVLGLRRLPASGAGKLSAGKSLTARVPVYTGSSGIVLVSALLEDDDGDAEPRAAELHLLTELGVGLAAAAGGSDPLETLRARLEEAFALLRVDDLARRGDKVARARVIRAPEQKISPIPKVAGAFESLHDTDGGDYALTFQVSAAGKTD